MLLWRAQVLRRAAEAPARRTGRPIEDSQPAALARAAAYSPWVRAARREEARFWIAMARSGERFEPKLGSTRRLSNRINRAYSDAIVADAGWAAPLAVPRLNARSRFDLAGRKRGRKLERLLARELSRARALSGLAPAACDEGLAGARWRFAPGALGPADSAPWRAVAGALDSAAQGHDDRALAMLSKAGGGAVTLCARGLVYLRTGRARQAEEVLAAALAKPDAATVRIVARTARALAWLGQERPDDALLSIGADLGQAPFAAVRLAASFISGDSAGARASLRRIPDGSALEPFRRAVAPGLVAWSRGRRTDGRAIIASVVARRPGDWDFSLPLGRYSAGRLDDLDAWLEQSAPRDGLSRVWQLYALERAARERRNDDRGDVLATLRRRICR